MAVDKEQELINKIMSDVTGEDIMVDKDEISVTIDNIFRQYGLSTETTFVEKVNSIKYGDGEEIDIDALPRELRDAAFLPTNTIADIALRQDIDMMVSQIPEWYTAIQLARDAICEADLVNGTLARNIVFDAAHSINEEQRENVISKIEQVEDRLELNSVVKNHIVFNALMYGEAYLYTVPYAKVFQDLYRYRLDASHRKNNESMASLFQTTSTLNGYGYGEAAVEYSLKEAIIQEAYKDKPKGHKPGVYTEFFVDVNDDNVSIFTESEIQELYPNYHASKIGESESKKMDDLFDTIIDDISRNIHYIKEPISIPVIEESAIGLEKAYELKYGAPDENGVLQGEDVSEVRAFFESVMGKNDNGGIDPRFSHVKGCYTRILPSTKMIPIRIDRTVIGYYYVSDLTRPEEAGERKNSGLGGYTLRTPSVGYDTFAPDQMFCERLATKIINNFDLKFMKDNTAVHDQIVAILQAHKFNEAMLRFVFIPAEQVCQFTLNKDGIGKGHSMLEPGLVSARLYMFLKLYSVLFQINNSQVRVYNLRMSGMDKNYKQFVQETIRKFAARRVTANDIFNYRSSMTKVSGGSELIMPMGTNDIAPITVDKIDSAESPIPTELLDSLKKEAINSTPVPDLMISGAMAEIDFAKQAELANTRFNTFIASSKLDLNRDITLMYRRILRWETDIDPNILKNLKFVFRMPSVKELNITNEALTNFNALLETLVPIFLSPKEIKADNNDENSQSDVVRAFKKQLLREYMSALDCDRIEELADAARVDANEVRYHKLNTQENITENLPDEQEGL